MSLLAQYLLCQEIVKKYWEQMFKDLYGIKDNE